MESRAEEHATVMESSLKILVVDDDPHLLFAHARILKHAAYEVIEATSGAEAVDKVKAEHPDLVLLDVVLPDADGREICRRIKGDPDLAGTYVMLISGALKESDDQAEGLEGGADGYVTKPIEKREFLARIASIARIARAERVLRRREEEIRALSITDELTGLHNRRGFLSLTRQQLKIADRSRRKLTLFFADLDGLKVINDTLGHEAGDQAILDLASILKDTFRDSDVLARLGGDEFAVLAVDAEEEVASLLAGRIHGRVDLQNCREDRPYRLSVSVGFALYDPECPSSLDELVARADQRMYEEKKEKRSGRDKSRGLERDDAPDGGRMGEKWSERS